VDDLTAVRELAADVPPPTDEARSAARVRLRRAVVQEGRPGALLSRRLMFRVAVAGTAAAAVAGGVLYATRGERDADGPRMATLSAAELLHRAADRTRADGAGLPIPRNDQYFYTRTHTVRTYTKGGRTRIWTDESWLSVDGSKPSRREEYGRTYHDPPLADDEVQWPPTEYAKLEKWPTDPEELERWLQKGGGKIGEGVFWNACLLMRGPRVMPPGLQAATFEVLAGVRGIRIDREVADELGRRAVSVTYPDADFAFLFDLRTYAYLGLRVRGSSADWDGDDYRRYGWYRETQTQERAAVVDRVGQRP